MYWQWSLGYLIAVQDRLLDILAWTACAAMLALAVVTLLGRRRRGD
jgi:hypothetical protein